MADAAKAATDGAATSNPWMSLGGSFLSGLGGAMGSQPGYASGQSEAIFDNSGWNVVFGGGDIKSESSKTQQGALDLENYATYALIAGGVLIAWRMTRRQK